MAIGPLSGPVGGPPAAPRADEVERVNGVAHGAPRPPHPPTAAQTPAAVPPVQRGSEMDQLKQLAADAQLELRLQPLPHSNVVVMRFVDPGSGEVVREFPPEKLAEALAEMRERVASRLDRQA